MATIKPALKSLYVTFIQFSLVKSSHRESKKVKNNFNRPNGVVGNFALFIYIVVDFNLLGEQIREVRNVVENPRKLTP
jgi:hypothetical protein